MGFGDSAGWLIIWGEPAWVDAMSRVATWVQWGLVWVSISQVGIALGLGKTKIARVRFTQFEMAVRVRDLGLEVEG